MPIFISYSHTDKEFAEKLAAHLVKNNAHVWVDSWELNVGDSILNRVQQAIQDSSALLVVLSNASIQSEWCRKELSAGLMRELNERQVIVLPVLLEDCKIPMFLQEKMYADFRKDFDTGLKSVLDAVARIANPNQGRKVEQNIITDWSVDWKYNGELFEMHFTIVQTGEDMPFTILTEVSVQCNEAGTQRYKAYQTAGLDWLGRRALTEFTAMAADHDDFRLILDSNFPQELRITSQDPKLGIAQDIHVRCRRLGEDNGKDQLVNVSNYLRDIRDYVQHVTRKPNEEELQRLIHLLGQL